MERLLIFLWLPVVALFAYFNLLPLLVITIWLLALLEIYERQPINQHSYLAVVHVTCFLSILLLDGKEASLVIGVVVLNDSFAYIGGKFMNFWEPMRRPLFPKTSPKKTWGGFFYGIAFSLIGGMGLANFLEIQISILTILLISFLAVIGDYIESSFKRKHGIKDSGDGMITQKLLKGHGGVYDRFDAIALASITLVLIKI